jgi:CHASE2 domain-containing sensor protein
MAGFQSSTNVNFSKLRRKISFVIFFLAACLITLGLETIAERAIESGDLKDPGLAPSVFELSGIYQRIVASGPRKPAPRFTVIVPIDPAKDKDPDLYNVCRQRAFLSDLIRAIADLSPAVIIVDKYFATECGKRDAGTIALQTAMRELSPRIPIVVGRRLVLDGREGSTGHGARTWPPLVEAPEFKPDLGIREGIVNIDPDTRRLPLGWTALSANGKGEWRHSLALKAAEAYDQKLTDKYSFLRWLIANKQHPYISFLKREDLDDYATYPTRDVLCGSKASRERLKTKISCPNSPRPDIGYLRGRIVIVAELNLDMDSHFSVIGRVPGYVLQANYIEALLDQRYFGPVPWWVNYGAGFLIYLAFHWILIKHHHALQKAGGWQVAWVFLKAVGWGVVVVAGTVAVLYLVVTHAGWYVNPATMGVIALVIKFSELIFAPVPQEEEEQE